MPFVTLPTLPAPRKRCVPHGIPFPLPQYVEDATTRYYARQLRKVTFRRVNGEWRMVHVYETPRERGARIHRLIRTLLNANQT
jgi:hypothetical protein